MNDLDSFYSTKGILEENEYNNYSFEGYYLINKTDISSIIKTKKENQKKFK